MTFIMLVLTLLTGTNAAMWMCAMVCDTAIICTLVLAGIIKVAS